ncbi:MAG: DUF3738 domain-containing protein [Bryobacteraceae bacterium]|jgi:uncharacterized protein (TIGR03435 family)
MPPVPPDGVQEKPVVDILGPTLSTALQEQLGLKLEARRGPAEILVIRELNVVDS